MFCNVVESNSLVDRSYSDIYTDSVKIDTSTYDINIDYTVASTTNVIIYYKDQTYVPGENYIATLTHTGSGSETFNIPTSTHNLINYNVTSQLYKIIGSEWVQVEEDQFLLANNGDVSVIINTTIAGTYELILSAAPTSNIAGGVVNASDTGTVVISGLSRPWIFYNIYLEQTAGGTKERVIAQDVSYNALTNEITLTFENAAPISRNFIVFYDIGDIRSNVLCVEDAFVTVDGVDLSPQITMWGLDHNEIYTNKTAREGWVNHIDTYRRGGEQRLISGLGGNLFSAQEYSEAAATYLYATLYPSLQSRSSATFRIGPVFYDTLDSPARTRGYITSNIAGTGWVRVTAVEYDTGTGQTKYTLSVPNMNIVGTLSTIISTSAGLEDWLTINNMSQSIHEGTFRIRQAIQPVDDQPIPQVIPDVLEIWVENSYNNSSDWDDLNVGGYAGIFTDQLSWLVDCSYIPEDTLILTGEELATVTSSDNSTTVCGPLSSLIQVPAGVLITGKRTSSLVPLREALPDTEIDSVTNLVRGDMLSYTGLNRQLRILSINADQDRDVSITSDGETATVTMLAGDTTFLSPGQQILLVGAGDYSGVQAISGILSLTQFTLNTTYTSSVLLATLSGKTIELDEELSWADTSGDQNAFQVIRRWIPIEAPDDQFNLTPDTHVRYFEADAYSDQSLIRSTMVADTLFLTNGRDEVMKFDGENIYRAGLPAWQPGLFVTQDTSVPGIVVPKLRTINYSGLSAGNKNRGEVQLNADDMYALPVGAEAIIDGDPDPYTVRGYEDKGSGGGTHVILFDRALKSTITAAGTISEVAGIYKYYFRLNAVDANDNIIASAMTSSDDMSVRMIADAAINIKLVGLPAFDNYDYDRIEVEIYRTKLLQGSTAPVFYKITTLAPTTTPSIGFNNTTGYVEYVDTFSDSNLFKLDPLSAIAGAELGINWSEPLRAKYITTTSNRLILGNIKDYPEFDMQIVKSADLSNSDIAGNTVLFRRDALDAGTSTDMVNRVKFEWRNGGSRITVTGITGVLNTSFTVAVVNTAAIGDWVYLSWDVVATTGRPLKYSGWWQIASCTSTSITINYTQADSGAIAVYPNRAVFSSISKAVPVLLSTDGNLGQLNGDSFDTFDATRRLALALNSVMRQTDVTISGQSEFRPWLISRSGNDLVSSGRIVVRSTEAVDIFPSVSWTFSNYSVFINSIAAASTENVSASQKIFPSRVLVSYPNYPEIYDNPTATLDIDSLSAIDVNPADGQEITGIIPFFGETAFTAAQQESALVVFKTNSIYLVNINQKVSGGSLIVQRLETQGLGCTAPYSIAVTKNGIMFANNSGIYSLGKDQSIRYIGKFMERNWVDRIDQSALELAQGHHYGVGRMYKLSVPLTEARNAVTDYLEPTEVYVYNHTQEDEENALGAWSRYDNHTALGWANLASDAFWASAGGNVYVLRKTNTEVDFRDSNEAINFKLDTRPNSYGNSGIRKVLDKVTVSYRSGTNNASNSLSFSVDLEQEYSPTTPFNVTGSSSALNGMSDIIGKDIITLRHSLDRRKGVYFSVRIENSNLDQNVEVAGIDYRIGALDSRGILSAGKT
jgi:hypothetical protein